MVSSNRATGTTFGADHHRNGGFAAKHVAVFGALVGNLVHRQGGEIDIHDLRHRAHSCHGSTNRRTADGGF